MARQDKIREQYEIGPQRIADLPLRLRPREQFEQFGPENVSDDILIAILLRSGVRGTSVLDLARKLLDKYGSLTELSRASVKELAQTPGMGPVKAQVLRAALELGGRLVNSAVESQPLVRTPEDAAKVLREKLRAREEESFWVLPLDTKYRLKRSPVEVTRGLLDSSLVHPREVFKEAVRSSSAAVVLVHNHPSGDPSPSAEDIRITRQLLEAGRIIDIAVLDHVILGRACGDGENDFFSLREAGIVEFKS